MMNYKQFSISDLFEICLSKGDLKETDCVTQRAANSIRLISAGDTNNGMVGYVSAFGDGKAIPFPGNVITVDMFCKAYYQSETFYAVSHGRVNILKPKFPLNVYIALFLCTIINHERYRYNYGRALYSGVLSRMIIQLPVRSDGEPDFEYMEDYIKSLPSMASCLSKMRDKSVSSKVSDPIDAIRKALMAHSCKPSMSLPRKWRKYLIGHLFDVRKGKRLTDADKTEGALRFIGAIDSNNGVTNWIDELPIHPGNVITVNYNGSVGEAFYQPEPFWASDDVNVLYPKGWALTPAIALFVCTIIRNEQYRFSYGRKWKLERMIESQIWLPSTDDGNPDWRFMDKYMKSLPIGEKLGDL